MNSPLQDAVERAVAQAIDERLPALRTEIARRVLDVIGPAVQADGAPTQLKAAFASIQESTSQADILSALLDGMARFSARVALFVLRGGLAQGWQARGLKDNDAVKAITVNAAAGLAARAAQTRSAVLGAAAEFDSRLAATFGAAAEPNALVLPLVVRDKVAALLYADGGVEPSGRLDAPAIELLVRTAAVWIELTAVRKAGAHVTEVASAGGAQAPVVIEASSAPPAAMAAAASAAAPVEGQAESAIAPEEEELHRKARRFAKLLVEEIKLYNQAKVAEGRQKQDLYERLKVDIAKSRASYDKRYAQTVVASADYFTEELIRILADGNVALLGSSFPR